MRWFTRPAPQKGPKDFLRMIQTERLVLRVFDPTDALDVFAYAKNPKVALMAGWPTHQSLEESRAAVQHCIAQGETWAIVEKKGGRVIGSIGLHEDTRREAENARKLVYALGESWWGQGYATEAADAILHHAFHSMNCPIVGAYHFPQGDKAQQVLKKMGFTYEGELRMACVLPDGRIMNHLCYSLTRNEYECHQKKETP